MINRAQSRRSFLSLLALTISSSVLLSACGFTDKKSKQASEKLVALLRYHRVAGHLGRLYHESDPKLQSLSQKKLVKQILEDISLDPDKLSDVAMESIEQHLEEKIRQDFADENVVTVDGWLLSQTEASVCALIFLNIQSTQS